jgi:hypothetical protein
VNKYFLLLSGCIALLSSPVQAAGGGKGYNGQSAPSPEKDDVINQPLSAGNLKAPLKIIFQRVVQARLFHSGSWTLAGSTHTPGTVARTISSLQPSFVTGLLRVPDRGQLSNAEVEGYDAVRNEIRKGVKNCRFDLVINAGADESGDLFVRRMSEITFRIHPDAWTFYVAPDDTTVNPDVFVEGIAYAHSQGQMVGYDGPLSLIPEGVDYIVVRAWNFQVNRKQLDFLRTKQRVPMVVEVPTTFDNKTPPEAIAYIREMDSSERSVALTQLAENQNAWGYHFAYPIFYPLYPAKHAFDVTKDNLLMVTIRSLLARFN